jgi:rubredoxin
MNNSEMNPEEGRKYLCSVCSFMYDPEATDSGIDCGVEPGTPFERLPDEWTCPLCGSGKESFGPPDPKMGCNRWD